MLQSPQYMYFLQNRYNCGFDIYQHEEMGDIHLKHLFHETKDNNIISQIRTPSVTRVTPSSRVACFTPTLYDLVIAP